MFSLLCDYSRFLIERLFMKTTRLFFGLCALATLLVGCNENITYIDTDHIEEISESKEFTFTSSADVPITFNAIDGGQVLQYSNGYLFFHNNYNRDIFNFPEKRTLMKYNVETDNLISVCSDPVCLHNTLECPFYAMYNTMYVFDGKIAYAQIYSNTSNDSEYFMLGQCNLYDSENLSKSVRNTIKTNSYTEYMKMLPVDNYLLYYENMYNEELDEWVDGIYRWDIVDNTQTILCGEDNVYEPDSMYPNTLACNFLFAMDSRIYFTDGAIIFSTDANYEKRIDHVKGRFVLDVFTDGEYIYYGVPVEEGSYIQSLHRVDFNGENDIELDIVTQKENVEITSNYIYYKKYDEVVIGKNRVSGYSGEDIILYSSEIWRCDHNGQKHELVYKFEGDMANYRILYETYVGNYIYGLYSWWEDADGDGIYEDGDDHFSATEDEYKIMRIDVTTGDIYIIDGIR